MGSEDGDAAGIRSEREFMDALRVLKARSGLSYREIVGRMSRADPRHASARSTLADLLAGNSLPRRPGQLRLLLKVLSTELGEPGQVGHYMQAWSRLIAARGAAEPPAGLATPSALAMSGTQGTPAVAVLSRAAARPVRSVPLSGFSPDRLRAAAAPPDEAQSTGRRVGVFLLWLVLSGVYLPAVRVIGWPVWLLIWLFYTIPMLAILIAGGGPRPVSVRDVPSEYLRNEYRASGPAARSGLAGRWPG